MGDYWSGTERDAEQAYYMNFESVNIFTDPFHKNYTYSVRCVKASAQTYDAEAFEMKEGLKAYENKEYAKAVEWFTKAAEKGNIAGMNALGMFYIQNRDGQKAFEWYSKSAEKGNDLGMYQLGWLYANYDDVKDYQKSREWFVKALENGYENAKDAIA